jgi:hypothetical protein
VGGSALRYPNYPVTATLNQVMVRLVG